VLGRPGFEAEMKRGDGVVMAALIAEKRGGGPAWAAPRGGAKGWGASGVATGGQHPGRQRPDHGTQ
jgi:hypothetical protein